jgi:hypothetical protein
VVVPVSTTEELAAQRRHLANYEHAERFGGRFLFPLAHLYRIGRAAIYARLAEMGTLEFNRERAFGAITELNPKWAPDVAAIEELAPFAELSRHPDAASSSLPFQPVGPHAEARFLRAREAVARIVGSEASDSE